MYKQPKILRGAVIFGVMSVLFSMATSPGQVAVADEQPAEANVPAEGIGSVIAFVRAHPSEYSGIYLDSATNHVIVGVPDGKDAVSALTKATSGIPAAGASSRTKTLTAVHQKRTLADLADIEARVGANTGEFGKLAGDNVSQWGLDEEHNTVQVGVLEMNDDLVASARKTYGDSVELRKVDRHYVAVRDDPVVSVAKESSHGRDIGILVDRQLDQQPYWAGDQIGWVHDGNRLTRCTSGWISGVTRGQVTALEFMYSAGHCFPQGVVIQQGTCITVNGGCQWTVTGDVGVVNSVEWGDNRMDWESISPLSPDTIDQNVFTGGPTSHTGVAEYDMGGVLLHQRICTEGSFTGQNCAGEVTSVNGCIRLFDEAANRTFLVCQQDFGASNNHTRMVNHGDSGGPVLGLDDGATDGNSFGHGIISGGNVGTSTNPGPGTDFNFSDGARICAMTPCF